MIGLGGLTALALADAATFLVSAALIAAIRHRRVAVPAVMEELGGAVGRLRREWAEGLRIVLDSRVLRVLFAFEIVTSMGEGVMGTLFAPFARDELHAGGTTYGLISSSQAIGGIAGGLVAAVVGPRFAAVRLWGAGALVFGALMAAQGAATLLGIAAAGVLGEVVGIIPVLIAQGVGYVAGGAVVLTLLARRPEPAEVVV